MEMARVTEKNPNPQGKGVVPVLRDWATMQPSVCAPKEAGVFLRDYCLSSLVLAANFRFKPVVGKVYFLYACESEWMLSLIGPHEWGARQPGAFLGKCQLRTDMTWAIDTGLDNEAESVALEKAQAFVRGFVDTLASQEAVAEHLPFYVSSLPYYQRMLATALATSLQRSVPAKPESLQAILGNSREWLPSLPPKCH